MENVKNRMYNYEITPPEGVWQNIANQLDNEEAKVFPIAKKRNHTFYYAAAASVVVILLSIFLFTNRSSKTAKEFVAAPAGTLNDTGLKADNNSIITVPEKEKTIAKNEHTTTFENTDKEITHIKSQKGRSNSDNNKEKTKVKETAYKSLIASNLTSHYITIEGPQGQPVKVSSKMSSLIDSSNDKVPPKPIWNKKINEWKEIMKGNTLAPTPGNFLDIIELTKTVKDHK